MLRCRSIFTRTAQHCRPKVKEFHVTLCTSPYAMRIINTSYDIILKYNIIIMRDVHYIVLYIVVLSVYNIHTRRYYTYTPHCRKRIYGSTPLVIKSFTARVLTRTYYKTNSTPNVLKTHCFRVLIILSRGFVCESLYVYSCFHRPFSKACTLEKSQSSFVFSLLKLRFGYFFFFFILV